ncbi:hypothetical protein [Kibdelosporangium philippinense]|uniref:hypothetical protein n=1 Tax=Kibdelosporangium philippinense TaxID=211113 RepID=UPI00360EB722
MTQEPGRRAVLRSSFGCGKSRVSRAIQAPLARMWTRAGGTFGFATKSKSSMRVVRGKPACLTRWAGLWPPPCRQLRTREHGFERPERSIPICRQLSTWDVLKEVTRVAVGYRGCRDRPLPGVQRPRGNCNGPTGMYRR